MRYPQSMEAKAPSESFTEMTELVLPQHTNAVQTAFGGVIMSWDAQATFVNIGDHGKPCPVPPLVSETDEDRRQAQMSASRWGLGGGGPAAGRAFMSNAIHLGVPRRHPLLAPDKRRIVAVS